MVNEENFEEQQNEIVFKLTVFNVDEEKVGEIQLTEADSILHLMILEQAIII